MAEGPQLPPPGSVIAGKYRVDRVLGSGGMGTVLAVRHLGLDEPRALKLMLPRGLELPQARERFFREARAAAKLRSDHAVRIHDVAVSPEGFPYIEMEMLEGHDLAQMLKHLRAVPIGQALRWIADACEPLGEAHALGIVHRDLKPGNLFLAVRPGAPDSIKVLDFGIAKTQQQAFDTDPSLTGTNASFGSPLYMSPEQMRGARFAEPRSDLWALGVVLYELITGRRPFQAESATALALVVTSDEPTPPSVLRPDVPPAVEAVILRCLAKKPEGRFGSAQELAAALRAALPTTTGDARGAQPSLPHPLAEARGPHASMPSHPGGSISGVSHPGVVPPAAPSSPGAVSSPGALSSPGGMASSGQVSSPGGPFPWTTPGARVAAEPAPAPQVPVDSNPMAFPPMAAGGAPSQPTVATLSTTVGGRSQGNALLVGGAIAAAILGLTVAVLLWRSGPSTSSASASSGAVATAAEPPPPVLAPVAPAPVETQAPADPPAAPPPVETQAAVEPPAPAEPVASAAPSASAARPPGGSSPTAASSPAGRASNAAPRPPRPKPTGFGGID